VVNVGDVMEGVGSLMGHLRELVDEDAELVVLVGAVRGIPHTQTAKEAPARDTRGRTDGDN
jgi:hypothetical protein